MARGEAGAGFGMALPSPQRPMESGAPEDTARLFLLEIFVEVS